MLLQPVEVKIHSLTH